MSYAISKGFVSPSARDVSLVRQMCKLLHYEATKKKKKKNSTQHHISSGGYLVPFEILKARSLDNRG